MPKLRKLLLGLVLVAAVVAVVASLQMSTSAPVAAFGYCETTQMCGASRGTFQGTCVDEDTHQCFEVYGSSSGQCLVPCS